MSELNEYLAEFDMSLVSDEEINDYYNKWALYVVDAMYRVDKEMRPAVYDAHIQAHIKVWQGLNSSTDEIEGQIKIIHEKVMKILEDDSNDIAPSTRH